MYYHHQNFHFIDAWSKKSKIKEEAEREKLNIFIIWSFLTIRVIA